MVLTSLSPSQEHLILKVLKFDMGGVTSYSFLQRFVVIAAADDVTKHLAMVSRNARSGICFIQIDNRPALGSVTVPTGEHSSRR